MLPSHQNAGFSLAGPGCVEQQLAVAFDLLGASQAGGHPDTCLARKVARFRIEHCTIQVERDYIRQCADAAV